MNQQSERAPARATETSKWYTTGSIIAAEGENSAGFFVLLSGKVGVFKGQMQVAEFAQPGIVFGELSLIFWRSADRNAQSARAYRGSDRSLRA